MNWAGFARASPRLAGLAEQRLDRYGLCLLGTLRGGGWPRISPIEPYVVSGELLLGMSPQSPKAQDLRRDERLVVHNCVTDRNGTEGDAKLYARAREVLDDEPLVDEYLDAVRRRVGVELPRSIYLVAADITSAGFVVHGDERFGLAWDPERGTRELAV